ncbi:MBL fold metallo-hydrolase [Saccharothrix variisporea]|uniref:Glyoxylase-like metal-dependent hydrolase (Beta-lactamase superfamily II) n=1 Tax=Saccharothrix variisporea TaxID=543527 RepID=A0A495X0E1_9PSEU|nr:MBL fold metallo-hydrolase [Saccharothrix variisporea]RKT67129.1 glyoxylase-like metal-dependent hydrolase (beta-lactamase superfamily II) [Saccharothrix variisporea]
MHVTRVNDQVHMVTGTNVNWALVSDGSALTLVDTGYPNDSAALLASIAETGHRPQDVTAILITHAHLDHIGGVPMMTGRFGTPVLTGAEEARHARREYLEQITPLEMLRLCGHRASRRWVLDTVRAVFPQIKISLPQVGVVPPKEPLDVPGGLVAIPTPGHTTGHTAYLMPSTGVLFSGDALVTGHPTSRRGEGPQRLPEVFNTSEDGVTTAIAALRDLPADTLVPGHGGLARGPLADMVDKALR